MICTFYKVLQVLFVFFLYFPFISLNFLFKITFKNIAHTSCCPIFVAISCDFTGLLFFIILFFFLILIVSTTNTISHTLVCAGLDLCLMHLCVQTHHLFLYFSFFCQHAISSPKTRSFNFDSWHSGLRLY